MCGKSARCVRILMLGGAIVSLPALLLAQRAPASGSGSGSTSGIGGAGSTTRGTAGTYTPYTPGGSTTTLAHPLFLSGRVALDDGAQPNVNIRIERVCAGSAHLEAHTDSKGRFSFQIGQDPEVDTDAADSSTGRPGLPNSGNNSTFGSTSRSNSLWNCELRAAYPGYRSDVMELGLRRSLDDPDVGTIVLHRLQNVQGSTISVTTELAPKHAQKEYEKGLQALQKGKLDDAGKHLSAATAAYPQYAIAWFALGRLQQRENHPDDARKSYEAAIAADKKYVSPYDQLATLALAENKWQDAADYSKRAIDLNPVEFPNAFWVNAAANYNLKQYDAAEKSALALIKLDTSHKFPDAENVLAHILAQKGQYADAAAHLRAYLALEPNAKNADALKHDLDTLQRASAEPRK